MKTRSYWSARLADARRPKFPVHRGHIDVDVAIVGGGLIGCTTAALLSATGLRTALVEARRIGEQGTAAAPGVILPEPAVSLTTLQAAFGRRAARAVWEMSRRAAFDFATFLRRGSIRCDLSRADAFLYVPARDEAREIERERDLRRELGIEGQWLTPARASSQIKTPAAGAIRVKAAAVFDPYRACIAMARIASSRRVAIFEKSPVTRVRPRQDRVEITTTRGTLAAGRVIVATGGPTRLFQPIARRFASLVSYRVITSPLPAAARRELPDASVMMREAANPAHTLRWTHDARLLFAGIERLRLPERSRPGALIQHSAQLMYELSLLYPHLSGIQPEYVWDAAISASDDGLPYIGPHRHYRRHLFALGAGRSDGASALLAARILVRYCTGTADKHDTLFGFGR